jgi:hypothetical protein
VTPSQLQALNNHLGLTTSGRVTAVPLDYEAATLGLVASLTSLDEALSEGSLNAMALDVGGLKVDFNRGLSLQRGEGSRLLRSLAEWLSLETYWDKYTKSRVDLGNSTAPSGQYVHVVEL